jgi:hypothetical protein
MHTITLKQKLTEEETKSLEGEYIDESYIDHLLQKDTIVTNEEGKTICVLIKNCIPSNIAESAYYSLRKAIATTNNRGIASGKLPTDLKVGDSFQGDIVGKIDNEYRYVPLKKDGTLSNSPKAKWLTQVLLDMPIDMQEYLIAVLLHLLIAILIHTKSSSIYSIYFKII